MNLFGPSTTIAPVHVLATTIEATRSALNVAQRPRFGPRGPILLLIPRSTTAAPDGSPSPAIDWVIAQFEHLAHECGPQVRVRICDGPNTIEAVKQIVPVRGFVLVGGRSRWWWPTVEERLVARLRRHGRLTVLVECDARTPPTSPARRDRRRGHVSPERHRALFDGPGGVG